MQALSRSHLQPGQMTLQCIFIEALSSATVRDMWTTAALLVQYETGRVSSALISNTARAAILGYRDHARA